MIEIPTLMKTKSQGQLLLPEWVTETFVQRIFGKKQQMSVGSEQSPELNLEEHKERERAGSWELIPKEAKVKANQEALISLGGSELRLNKRQFIEKVLFVILNQPSHTLSLEEREQVGEIVYEGIPAKMRPLFWIKCSGLSAYKSNYCDNYYKRLCTADESGTLF